MKGDLIKSHKIINLRKRNIENGDGEIHYEYFTGTPSEMAKKLNKVKNCKEFLEYQHVDYWIHDYISGSGCSTYDGINAMMYIMYALIFILDEIKALSFIKKKNYLSNIDSLLTEVTLIAKEEKGWRLDRHALVSLCSKIVEDYVYGKINVESKEIKFDCSLDEENPIIVKRVENNTDRNKRDYILFVYPQLEESALRQIIRNYPDTALEETYDAVWEWFFDYLMGIHDDDEDLLDELYDMRELEAQVRNREILPGVYATN